MIYIIGSGPSGVSAAVALLKRNERVTILDVGLTREDTIEKSSSRKNLKSTQGSFFSYDFSNKQIYKNKSGYLGSKAFGGHSNTWGANLYQFKSHDLVNWEIDMDDLDLAYKSVLEFVPSSVSTPSENEQFFAKMLIFFSGINDSFNAQYSKLAINKNKCKNSQSCLSGCNNGAIYNSSHTIEELLKDSNFSYKKNIQVIAVNEIDGEVMVRYELEGIESFFKGKKCLLAAGPLNNLIILKKSGIFNKATIKMQDSQYFIFPAFSLKNLPLSEGFSLSKFFIAYKSKKINSFFQIYRFQKIFIDVGFNLKYSKRFISFLSIFFSRKVLITQAYLDSINSVNLNIFFDENKKVNIHFSKVDRIKALLKINAHLMHLSKFFLKTGFFVFPFLVKVLKPGSGFRCGGLFPMKKTPNEDECDFLGRLNNCINIHLIDTSIFNTIPPGPITLTAMANAYRIASKIDL